MKRFSRNLAMKMGNAEKSKRSKINKDIFKRKFNDKSAVDFENWFNFLRKPVKTLFLAIKNFNSFSSKKFKNFLENSLKFRFSNPNDSLKPENFPHRRFISVNKFNSLTTEVSRVDFSHACHVRIHLNASKISESWSWKISKF